MQNIEFGNGKLSFLEKIISRENPRKILILRGQSSFENFSDNFFSFIKSDYVCFIVKESNINFNLVFDGLNYYKEKKCDMIISIGGGSVIDLGKLISIFSANELEPKSYINGKEIFRDKKNKLISIPTTSGSGSESTHFAVVYDGKTKYSVAHASILPDYSIVDPELTYTLPRYQTAVSGMDALCQGIESFWSLKSTNESKKYSAEAIKLLLENIENAVLRPTSEARYNMALGSHLAGKAINISKTTAPHALSYPLTQFFGIPHGHAVCLTIGKFYEYNYNELNGTPHEEKMLILNEILAVNNGFEARFTLESLMSRIGLFTKLPKSTNFNTVVNKLVQNINTERLVNNPAIITKTTIRDIFKSLCSD